MRLTDQFEPKSYEDYAGQKTVLRQLSFIRRTGSLAGRAYWIEGPSGTGKTTLAKLIAHEVADDLNVTSYDAMALRAQHIADVGRDLSCYGMGEKNGHAVLINEAHAASKGAVLQLLVTLDDIRPHTVWIFTTTAEGGRSAFDQATAFGPLMSRCTRLTLTLDDLTPYAERAKRIAEAFGAGGAPLIAYEERLQKLGGNMRSLLAEVERGDFFEDSPAPKNGQEASNQPCQNERPEGDGPGRRKNPARQRQSRAVTA